MSLGNDGPRLLGQLVPLSVGTSSQQVLGANSRRVGLLISSASAAQVSYSFGTATPAAQGINVPANSQPLRLTYSEVGELIRQPVFAAASVGGALCSILEVSLP